MQIFKFDTLLGILVLYNEKLKNICFCLLDQGLFGNSCRAWVFLLCFTSRRSVHPNSSGPRSDMALGPSFVGSHSDN